MAENEAAQHDRTEPPTQKRLDDARRRGQVPRSRELSMTAVVIAGAAVFLVAGPHFAEGFAELVQIGLTPSRAAMLEPERMRDALNMGIAQGLKTLAPLFAVLVAAGVLGSIALGGWAFSFEVLTPKLEKLNPLKGLKRLFGWHGFSELAKALAKCALVGTVGGLVVAGLAADFMELGTLTLAAGLERAARLTMLSFAGFAATLILIAAADVPFQAWQHTRQLRMTKQEQKDEQKESDGRPEVRSRIRALQREIAQRRMMADVPEADVVAMNPTHFAVALKYDAGKMKAPRVVAKGADLVAFNIRRVAEAHGVPIFEHPQFARALYYTSDIGQEISPRLYVAVAQVLTYIYQLKKRPSATARKPGPRPAAPPSKPELTIDADLAEPRRGRLRSVT
jgi:flagellar biosynthetic protein FlhB